MQMLRAGKAKPQIETWPKAKKSGEVTLLPKANDDSDDSDREDKAFVPVFQSSFGDAIEQALNKFKKLGSYNTELFWAKTHFAWKYFEPKYCALSTQSKSHEHCFPTNLHYDATKLICCKCSNFAFTNYSQFLVAPSQDRGDFN